MRTIAIFILMIAGVQFLKADEICCEWASYAGTNQYTFQVGSEVVDKTPLWQESDDQPPLAARKALRAARACLAKLVANAEHWRLDEVSLSPLLEHEGHWIYLVKFYPPLPPDGILQGFVEPMTVPVLMSGLAVQPKIDAWKR